MSVQSLAPRRPHGLSIFRHRRRGDRPRSIRRVRHCRPASRCARVHAPDAAVVGRRVGRAARNSRNDGVPRREGRLERGARVGPGARRRARVQRPDARRSPRPCTDHVQKQGRGRAARHRRGARSSARATRRAAPSAHILVILPPKRVGPPGGRAQLGEGQVANFERYVALRRASRRPRPRRTRAPTVSRAQVRDRQLRTGIDLPRAQRVADRSATAGRGGSATRSFSAVRSGDAMQSVVHMRARALVRSTRDACAYAARIVSHFFAVASRVGARNIASRRRGARGARGGSRRRGVGRGRAAGRRARLGAAESGGASRGASACVLGESGAKHRKHRKTSRCFKNIAMFFFGQRARAAKRDERKVDVAARTLEPCAVSQMSRLFSRSTRSLCVHEHRPHRVRIRRLPWRMRGTSCARGTCYR